MTNHRHPPKRRNEPTRAHEKAPGPSDPTTPLLGWLCAQGWEDALIGELHAAAPDSTLHAAAPGLVVGTDCRPLRAAAPIFARQWLPHLTTIRGTSIKELVAGIGTWVDPTLDAEPLPWVAHFGTPDRYTLDAERYVEIGPRATLLADAFLERMQTFRKRAMTRHQDWLATQRRRDAIVIQGVMTARNVVWLSVARPTRLPDGRFIPCVGPDPTTRIPHDATAPCRSYYKLEEALLEAGMAPRPSETCVDLGAAPGGWTWSALRRGARVIAVDAADLAPAIADHPNCDHRRDNGYAFMPARRVDWLFCDMIVRPMATLGLLERWLAASACRRFVVNVKFRGKDPSTIVVAARELAVRFSLARFAIFHLVHDRNEITLFGSVD